MSVVLGDGAGGFGNAINLAVGNLPDSAAVGDFNSGMKPDLAVTNRYGDTVSVLLNRA